MKLEVENITKKYKYKTAVDNVSITFTPGVWGLLGANGAGKTTLMRMIAGIMEPTEGKILYDGVPIETLQGEYRRIFGYLPPGIQRAGLSGIYGGVKRHAKKGGKKKDR